MLAFARIACGAVLGAQLVAVNAHDDNLSTLAFRLPEGKKVKLAVAGTDAAPAVKGAAEVEYKQGRSLIKLSVAQLPDPRRVGPFSTAYIAWIIRGDGVVEKLAEVPVKKQTVSASTSARTVGVIVTAEPYALVALPSPLVVAELAAAAQPDPAVQPSLVSYRGDSGELYEGLSAPAPTPDSLTPLVVLGARRSVAVARKAQAEQYAQAELGMATSRLDSLEVLWNRNLKNEKAYAELARETMRRGDIARRLASDRAAEASQEAERQRVAAERQQQQAAQQAALDSASQAAAAARAEAGREAERRAEAEKHAAELESRLFSSVSSILETRKEARGMIATLAGVNFETNKAILKPVAREKLSKLSGILLGYPGEYKLGIEGHTDSVGSDTHNLKLSLARAQSVKDFLAEQGIPDARIPLVEGFGRTRPAAPNDTPANREKNRRVEIVIE